VVLIATAFLFAGIALFTGTMRTEELGAIFHRIYGTLSDRDEVVYAAVPMLLFMGAILHETRLAANLLSACARAFGRVRGGRGEMSLADVWRGAMPYVVLQLLVVLAVAALPDLATWLPAQLLDRSIPKAPKFSD